MGKVPSFHMLDLSTLVARVVLALLTGATFVLLGLWLREGDALGFAATLVSVTVTWYAMSALRGARLGKPTAATARLQPIVDALGEYPGGKIVAEPGFKRAMSALGVGIGVALVERFIGSVLLSGLPIPVLWRGLIALAIILLPVYIVREWLTSKQNYEGTRFASRMLDAFWKVLYPNSTTTPWADTSVKAKVIGFGVARTAVTLAARIGTQILLPMVFSNWMSIGFALALIVTCIAGWPIIKAGVTILRKRNDTTTTLEDK